uniref:Oxalate decarboxylase n=2 Tax=Flammulina TaxID=38944 RepID=Q9UVK4_FLAVE|nr:oxalate decarboxylase [Flammulina velutipes]AAO89278.1 oxalate decarboxylase [Flammulina sp. IJF 140502]
MFNNFQRLLTVILLSGFTAGVPLASTTTGTGTATGTSTAAEPSATVPFASTDPNPVLWNETSDPALVKPERNQLGATIQGPDNLPIDLQNPDLLAPPTTDHGFVGNAKWPFSFSKQRLQTGGWARQQNEVVLPLATNLACTNMRLEAGAIRELHWHKNAEWAYVLKGSTQISAVDNEGRNYISTVGPGDLWYFPPGIPHSLQATADDPEGSEFILVFDSGAFNDDGTFLLTDWLSHVPMEVILKNFRAKNPAAWSHIPAQQLYIFPSEPPADNQPDPVSPQGTVPLPYSFNFSSVEPTQYSGGTAKIADSTTFNISVAIAVAEVTVEPGALRELHWHPTEDEWTFFISGNARVTIFAAQSVASTFDYQGGDIAYVPASMGHYVENIGNTTLTYLEVFNTDRFADVSLSQWLALTPPSVVQAHLNLDDETLAELKQFATKATVVGPVN